MDFTLDFINLFIYGISLAAPLLAFFALLIAVLGQLVRRVEGWSRFDAFYWSFITATTVGYGDIRPTCRFSRIISILIALLGIMFTGIIVAITISTATTALKKHATISAEFEQHAQLHATTLSPSPNPFPKLLTQATIL